MHPAFRRRALAGVLLSCFAALAGAQLPPATQPLPAAAPQDVGLSPERLQRIGGNGTVGGQRVINVGEHANDVAPVRSHPS